MRCHEASEALSRRLDIPLSPLEEQELNEHLRTCPACRQEQQSALRLSALLEGSPMAYPPETLTQRVMAQVERAKRRVLLLQATTILLLGMAAGLSLCLVAVPTSPAVEGTLMGDVSPVAWYGAFAARFAQVVETLWHAAGLLSRALPGYQVLLGLMIVVVWLFVGLGLGSRTSTHEKPLDQGVTLKHS